MRALVTGAAGFVGRHMVKALLERGYEVDGVDLRFWHVPTLIGYKHYVTDCRTFWQMHTPAQQRYDLVVHLAAIVGGRQTIEGNPLAVADDLSIDAEFFQWVVRTEQPKVVYYSSSAAYPIALQGNSRPEHYLEEDNFDFEIGGLELPDMTYGWAKLTGEYLARFVPDATSRVYIFRPFSGYGEDQDPSYPFPAFIQRAKQRANPFTIWGDGWQTRDFIHIDDIVEATLTAVEQNVVTPVNLCTGQPTSFNTLADLVTRAAGYSPRFVHIADAPIGVQFRVGDPKKMLSFYRPKISLEEGIERALKWTA